MKIGAHYLGDGNCEFRVWAPMKKQVAVQLLTPEARTIPLEQQTDGYWQKTLPDIQPGTLYRYELDGNEAHPDPASFYQPEGVHGPSQVIDPAFKWTDGTWKGIPLESMILYELHVGTFTPEGTFEAIISRLKDLRETGVNAIELMPIGQFPGDNTSEAELAYRNWGYDGVFPFAVQNSYGGPQGLKKLIDACHREGIAVVLDVVYNHFGPEGNYMSHFGPYFTEIYRTPWGAAMNFDDAHSPGVRNYFLQNALYWLRDFHFDGLRLDATQAIYDLGAKHFLQELAEVTAVLSQEEGWQRYLIAESDLNDPKMIRSPDRGGYGLDAQWCDDFHHSLHALLTGDNQAYYQDFGKCAHLAKAYEDSFVYDWKYAPHRYRFHGISGRDRPPSQFVVFTQNHDQVGNQMLGRRLSQRLSFEALKLAAGAIFLSPSLPMLFMGEEYGEDVPFTYFISHSQPDLIRMVQEGRKKEGEAFHYECDPQDPQAIETYLICKLHWEKRQQGSYQVLLNFHRHLIQLRQSHPALLNWERDSIQASGDEEKKLIILQRSGGNSQLICLLNFNREVITTNFPTIIGTGHQLLNSADESWKGPGSSLPKEVSQGQEITIPAEAIVVYEFLSNG
ncbi:MAG: malto-oligosyltrehalose trehalohydrolase [Leptolyngbyaceae cyanobacterium bins.59]|nr:malto-oligosyltrehalose trehalohydrolase [Leptolyngbyaceae cyanobacterium bins.59]